MRDCRLHDPAPLLKEPPTQRRDSKHLPPGPLEQPADHSTHTSRPSTQGPGWRTRRRRGGPRTVAGGCRQLHRCGMPALTITSCDFPRPPRTSPQRLSRETEASAVSKPPDRLPEKSTDLRWLGTDKGHRGSSKGLPAAISLVCLIGQISCCCIRLDRTSGLARVTVDSTN